MEADCIVWYAEAESPIQGEKYVLSTVRKEHGSPASWKHQGMACASQRNWIPLRTTDTSENCQPRAHHSVVRGNP